MFQPKLAAGFLPFTVLTRVWVHYTTNSGSVNYRLHGNGGGVHRGYSVIVLIMQYFTYLLECADGTLYCGCTHDLTKRLTEHNNSKRGARYTKMRRPVKLVYVQEFDSKNDALGYERVIKKMSRKQKLHLVGLM